MNAATLERLHRIKRHAAALGEEALRLGERQRQLATRLDAVVNEIFDALDQAAGELSDADAPQEARPPRTRPRQKQAQE